ncbi:hypothetical protein BDC45DRAFT_518747 [Circinella umbellata]|nr:hypothetical protein BDC45DRAFT_518747 [Circinella umbellata]
MTTSSFISNLPQELIDRIAQLLTQEDRHACILVCKQWHKVFLSNLYKNVKVRTRQALQNFFMALQKSLSISPEYPLGWVVRDLTLGHGTQLLPYRATDLRDKNYRIGLSRPRWNALPRLCPYLEVLDFHWTTWIEIEENNSDVLFQWQSLRQIAPFHRYDILYQFIKTYGQRLTHLELTRAVVEQVMDWKSLLIQVPVLSHLTLTCAIDFGSLMVGPLTIQLDDLIPYLPKHLKSLSLTMFNINLRQGQQLHTHKELRSLDFHMVEFRSPAAIICLGQSFPQLRSLSIGRAIGTSGTLDRQDHIQALATMLQQSHHLKYLALNPIWNMKLLGSIRHASLLELRTGSLNGQIEHQPGTRIAKEAFPKLLACLSADATVLEIAVPPTLVNIDDWIRPLSTSCPRLSTLELTGNRDASYLLTHNNNSRQHHFPLHTILDALAGSLQSLIIRNAIIYVPSQQRSWQQQSTSSSSLLSYCDNKQHATILKNFGVHHSIIRADIFDYLAIHCPLLIGLSVTDCHYYVSLPRVHLDIRFPNHDLQSVVLRSIGVVCEQPEQQKTSAMGMSLALKYKGEVYHSAYHKPSFVRNLVRLDRFPFLTPEEIKLYSGGNHGTTEVGLETLQKEWFRANREHRYAYGQNLIPDKSFGYISLEARVVRKCSFESVLI